ncbi:MAG: hypothetical protein JRI97_10630 [Deltaproteobacteria bacterium]|nr:hypothetical protein [Deltaproteobacteria bacterium]
MATAFLLAAGLVFVLAQTAPPDLAFRAPFDLGAVYVLYLSLFRPPVQAALLAGLLGSAMDIFAGGPPGPYLAAYLWIFVGARAVPRYVRPDNPLFLAGTCAAAVFVEALVLGGAASTAGLVKFWGRAVFWAGATGWICILALDAAMSRLEGRFLGERVERGAVPERRE